jgi:hypothetical protein
VNIDNLYFGLGYENHAKGQLMRLGYEAFKMEADFGFDLLVTNQAKKTFKNITEGDFYVFQVKAGRVYDWKEHDGSYAGTRKEGTACFYLSKEHLEKLISEPKSYLLCYIVDGNNNDMMVGYFWLNNSQLNYLQQGKNPSYGSSWTWFHEKNGYYFLKARIVLEAKLNEQYNRELQKLKDLINDHFNRGTKEYKSFKDVHDRLEYLLNKSDITNKNSSSRIELFASTKNSGEFGSTRILKEEQLELSKFINSKDSNPFKTF